MVIRSVMVVPCRLGNICNWKQRGYSRTQESRVTKISNCGLYSDENRVLLVSSSATPFRPAKQELFSILIVTELNPNSSGFHSQICVRQKQR